MRRAGFTLLRSGRPAIVTARPPLAFLVVAAFGASQLGGCETPPTQGPRGPSANQAAARGDSRPSGTGENATVSAHPVAAWRDHTWTLEELQPSLVEIAGATVLRDAFLDFRIAQALKEQGIVIDAAAIDRERALLVASLDPNPNIAERLLGEIRVRQGLGPVRFEALLRRNAGLRALVQPDVRITPEALARQHEAMHGATRVVRVISVTSLAEADHIKRDLDGGASFIEIATKRSNDASAARGGLLAPMARTDPSWPESFRQLVFALGPNEISVPTLVDQQYLIVQLVEERPGDGSTLAGERSDVERALRLAQERVLMEERARAYLAEAKPVIYDSSFDHAWRQSAP